MSAHGGNLKRKAQLNKKNGSRSPTSCKFTYRVYCSFCGIKDHSRPNDNVFSNVASGQHFYRCKMGHRGVVGGPSYSGDKLFKLENKQLDEIRAGLA